MEQEGNQKQPATTVVGISDVCKRVVVCAWLAFLYILCIALVMSSLSGSLFQDQLIKIEKPINKFDSNNQRIINGATPLPTPTVKEYRPPTIQSDIKPEYYSLNEIIGGYELLKIGSRVEMLKYSKLSNTRRETQRTRLEDSVKTSKKELEELLSKMEKIEKEKGMATSETNKTSDDIQTLDLVEADFLLANQNIDKKNATLDFFAIIDNNPKIVPLFLEMEKFNSFFNPIKKILGIVTFGTLTEHFWSFPRPILRLNLILSMGILGSLIFVTIEFIRDPLKHSLEMYLFRPFLGMLIALAMYVMVKSGQSSLLVDGARDLSPFLISFLGIISGMLAEQAYRRISFTGSSLFSTGTNVKNVEPTKEA